jgi:glucose/arabinose dehydrogenase
MLLLAALLALAATLAIVACGGSGMTATMAPAPAPTPPPPPSSGGNSVTLVTEDVATGLTVPWEIVFAADGRMFFTEQPGRLRVMVNGTLQTDPVFSANSPGGEGGMLGLELDRNFATNHLMYVVFCTGTQQTPQCELDRLVEANNHATVDKVLLNWTSGFHHTAGRLKLGPDGFLYLAVGDAWDDPSRAQNTSIPQGKILRITTDGAPAPGNPGLPDARIYSYGHRDPQGLAFDSSGALYSSEHGPVSNDEINVIMAGKNYGWPTCVGMCANASFVDPVKLWSPMTAAPSGATFYNSTVIPQWNGSMLVATMGLADNTFAHHIHRIKFSAPGSTTVSEEEALYKDQFGRIRDVVQGPDGFVYFSTSNGGGMDKIVRIKPK